jgi:c-di-GMP-binding flagellar brake protein YcgR
LFQNKFEQRLIAATFTLQILKEVFMSYTGPERRKYPRINARFIVSYRVLGEEDNVDLTQTKNISLGGMLLTTNRQFKVGTNIALEIRLPFDPHPIMIIGKVLESHEVTKNLIYDTRLLFMAIDEKHKSIVKQTVDYYLKKG